jgi:hypothetical protein
VTITIAKDECGVGPIEGHTVATGTNAQQPQHKTDENVTLKIVVPAASQQVQLSL